MTSVPFLVMAVWTTLRFTSGIYRPRNPKSTLRLAALFHVSVFYGLALGMVQQAGKSPAVWPYGVGRGPREGFRYSQ